MSDNAESEKADKISNWIALIAFVAGCVFLVTKYGHEWNRKFHEIKDDAFPKIVESKWDNGLPKAKEKFVERDESYLRHGECLYWSESGAIERRTHYTYGQKNGTEKLYDRSGKIVGVLTYHADSLNGYQFEWNESLMAFDVYGYLNGRDYGKLKWHEKLQIAENLPTNKVFNPSQWKSIDSLSLNSDSILVITRSLDGTLDSSVVKKIINHK